MRPPPWSLIDKIVKKTGMKTFHFELYHGINHNHLAQVKRGQRELSTSYWHIFYEFGKRVKKEDKQVPGPVPKKTLPQITTDDTFVHERFSILK